MESEQSQEAVFPRGLGFRSCLQAPVLEPLSVRDGYSPLKTWAKTNCSCSHRFWPVFYHSPKEITKTVSKVHIGPYFCEETSSDWDGILSYAWEGVYRQFWGFHGPSLTLFEHCTLFIIRGKQDRSGSTDLFCQEQRIDHVASVEHHVVQTEPLHKETGFLLQFHPGQRSSCGKMPGASGNPSFQGDFSMTTAPGRKGVGLPSFPSFPETWLFTLAGASSPCMCPNRQSLWHVGRFSVKM